jgi:hypothetical protein
LGKPEKDIEPSYEEFFHGLRARIKPVLSHCGLMKERGSGSEAHSGPAETVSELAEVVIDPAR